MGNEVQERDSVREADVTEGGVKDEELEEYVPSPRVGLPSREVPVEGFSDNKRRERLDDVEICESSLVTEGTHKWSGLQKVRSND